MANEYDKTIKANLAARRKQENLTQAALAEKVNIDRNTYRNIESGATIMINPHLPAICRELHCTIEELLLGYDPSSPDTNPHLSDIKAAYGNRFDRTLEEARKQNEQLQVEVDSQAERIRVLENIIQDKTDLIGFLKAQNRELQEKNSK
ncbi:MAG: helix-turn-helix transcriptional regulator [Bacteroidales bacterium]|nr:helix-turn-helix transcriptional regulator [Bacteroidales bacterium]